jgi:CheY-like chemotaxis protein
MLLVAVAVAFSADESDQSRFKNNAHIDVSPLTIARSMGASAALRVATFSSVEDCVATQLVQANACVVAHERMPGASGLDLPEILTGRGSQVPVILVTAQDTELTRDRAQNRTLPATFASWSMTRH